MHKRTVAILGGSFDPPHGGHVELASKAQLLVDEVWVVPCGYREDKPQLTSFDIRYQMCMAVFRQFKVMDFERGRPNTPTYYLMKELHEQFQELSFYFIIGTDLLKQMQGWHEFEKLIIEFNFLVFNRPGIEVSEDISNSYLRNPNFLKSDEVMETDMSSTFIRNAIREARNSCTDESDLRKILSDVIHQECLSNIIIEHNLYN